MWKSGLALSACGVFLLWGGALLTWASRGGHQPAGRTTEKRGRYLLDIPKDLSREEAARAEWAVRFLQLLQGDIDKELLDAKLLKKSDLRVPTQKNLLWPVRYFRTKADLLARLIGASNTQGTAFYEYQGRLGNYLAFIPTGDATKDRRNLLQYGLEQILRERLRLRYGTTSNVQGGCFPFGLVTYFRWTFLPEGDKAPRQYGGIPRSTLLKERDAIRNGTFPGLKDLFEAPWSDLQRSDGTFNTRLTLAAVLFIDFLFSHDPDQRKLLWRAADIYAKKGYAPERYPLSVVTGVYRKIYKDAESMEKEFQAYVLGECENVNRGKWKARNDGVEPGDSGGK